MLKLTPTEQKKLLAATKGRKSISAQEYREILQPKTQKKKNNTLKFNFLVKLAKLDTNKYIATMWGRHFSENSINAFGLKQKIKHKSSINKAFMDAGLIYKKILPREADSVILSPITYNPRSRDDGNNSATIKIMVDSLVRLGFSIDDKKEFAILNKCKEIISNDWKIEIFIETMSKEELKKYRALI